MKFPKKKYYKIKFIIPLFIFTYIFTSCSKDDDNNSKIDELNITEENTLFEGHWYAIHLNNELDEVQIEIDSLQTIIDDFGVQTPQSTLDAFDQATTEQSELNVELTAQNSLNTNLSSNNAAIGKIFPPIPPCLCAPVGTDYFMVTGAVKKLKVTFLNANGALIGSFDSLDPIPDYTDNLQYSTINLYKYTGLMTMLVEKEGANGETISYQVNNIAVQ